MIPTYKAHRRKNLHEDLVSKSYYKRIRFTHPLLSNSSPTTDQNHKQRYCDLKALTSSTIDSILHFIDCQEPEFVLNKSLIYLPADGSVDLQNLSVMPLSKLVLGF